MSFDAITYSAVLKVRNSTTPGVNGSGDGIGIGTLAMVPENYAGLEYVDTGKTFSSIDNPLLAEIFPPSYDGKSITYEPAGKLPTSAYVNAGGKNSRIFKVGNSYYILGSAGLAKASNPEFSDAEVVAAGVPFSHYGNVIGLYDQASSEARLYDLTNGFSANSYTLVTLALVPTAEWGVFGESHLSMSIGAAGDIMVFDAISKDSRVVTFSSIGTNHSSLGASTRVDYCDGVLIVNYTVGSFIYSMDNGLTFKLGSNDPNMLKTQLSLSTNSSMYRSLAWYKSGLFYTVAVAYDSSLTPNDTEVVVATSTNGTTWSRGSYRKTSATAYGRRPESDFPQDVNAPAWNMISSTSASNSYQIDSTTLYCTSAAAPAATGSLSGILRIVNPINFDHSPYYVCSDNTATNAGAFSIAADVSPPSLTSALHSFRTPLKIVRRAATCPGGPVSLGRMVIDGNNRAFIEISNACHTMTVHFTTNNWETQTSVFVDYPNVDPRSVVGKFVGDKFVLVCYSLEYSASALTSRKVQSILVSDFKTIESSGFISVATSATQNLKLGTNANAIAVGVGSSIYVSANFTTFTEGTKANKDNTLLNNGYWLNTSAVLQGVDASGTNVSYGAPFSGLTITNAIVLFVGEYQGAMYAVAAVGTSLYVSKMTGPSTWAPRNVGTFATANFTGAYYGFLMGSTLTLVDITKSTSVYLLDIASATETPSVAALGLPSQFQNQAGDTGYRSGPNTVELVSKTAFNIPRPVMGASTSFIPAITCDVAGAKYVVKAR